MEEKLIEAVKKHEVLYKKCSLIYRNKLERAAAWNSIANELDIPEIVCKSRWKSLRDRFVKKHTENYVSGSGGELEENQWQYYQQMEFLREHIKPRKIIASLSSQQPLDVEARKKRKRSTDQNPIIESEKISSCDNAQTDNTEIPVYNFLGKFEVNVEDEVEDAEYQTLKSDEEFIRIRRNSQMLNSNYEHILTDSEMENNEIENHNIPVSSAINIENIFKRDSLDIKKSEHFKNKTKNIESQANAVNANEIICPTTFTNQNINRREEEQLLNFFRSCIDDILMLDKRKQRLLKRRILDIIEELQDS